MISDNQERDKQELVTRHSSLVTAVKIIECPRDAWQGLPKIIPTEAKVAYLACLLRVGFRRIDAVSFVSPKYVPQMADSESVMQRLNAGKGTRNREQGTGKTDPSPRQKAPGLGMTTTRKVVIPSAAGGSVFSFPTDGDEAIEIIGIVVNEQGFRRALATPGVTTIGYPYSLSERFSRQNANMSQAESRELVEKLQRDIEASVVTGPNLVIYLSMAFGNPYGEPWRPEMVAETIQWLKRIGVRVVSLADTVGKARPEDVGELFRDMKDCGAGMDIGVHLHSRPDGAAEKVLAAYEAGCRRFDSALTGLGGCPFAGDEMVGNIPTEIVAATLTGRGVPVGLEASALAEAVKATEEIRGQYGH